MPQPTQKNKRHNGQNVQTNDINKQTQLKNIGATQNNSATKETNNGEHKGTKKQIT